MQGPSEGEIRSTTYFSAGYALQVCLIRQESARLFLNTVLRSLIGQICRELPVNAGTNQNFDVLLSMIVGTF